jgi:5-methyltetrahydrofolate--homocysteine methyltransferase
MNMGNEILEKLTQAVLMGDMETVPILCQEAADAGIEPMVIINDGMAPGARAAGTKFSSGEYFLPQLVLAGEAMKAGLEVLLPLITAEAAAQAKGVVVIGSVEGDVHDIGKNIVASLMLANGFRVVDLGIDVPAADFVEKAKSEKADILAMGSYLSTTLPQMSAVIEALQKAGIRDQVKVMVGGAAVTQAFADKIGADGFSEDAAKAVDKAIQFVGGA